jgi:hypothetical protein
MLFDYNNRVIESQDEVSEGTEQNVFPSQYQFIW